MFLLVLMLFFRQAISAQQDTINQLCAQVLTMQRRINQLCHHIDRPNTSVENQSADDSGTNAGKDSGEGN